MRTRKKARMENSVDLTTERLACYQPGVCDYRINLQPTINGPSLFGRDSPPGASVVDAQ